jgi:hypothetical protein
MRTQTAREGSKSARAPQQKLLAAHKPPIKAERGGVGFSLEVFAFRSQVLNDSFAPLGTIWRAIKTASSTIYIFPVEAQR